MVINIRSFMTPSVPPRSNNQSATPTGSECQPPPYVSDPSSPNGKPLKSPSSQDVKEGRGPKTLAGTVGLGCVQAENPDVDPQLETAWFLSALELMKCDFLVSKFAWFQSFAFSHFNLYRYSALYNMQLSGGALQVESSSTITHNI
jgi:hypothetical protein